MSDCTCAFDLDDRILFDLGCPVHGEFAAFADEVTCGCGQPWAAHELVQKILELCPLYESQDELLALLPDDGVRQFILSQIERLGLLEHGGSISGSWLTSEGGKARDLYREYGHLVMKP